MPLRDGGSVLHVCTCGAMFGFSGFLLRLRVPVSLFRQNGMEVAFSLPYIRLRQPYIVQSKHNKKRDFLAKVSLLWELLDSN